MKTFLQLLACTALVLFLGRELVWFAVSDETKIRWTTEKMVEGFNDTRLSKTLSGLHPDWRVPHTSVDRPRLADGLRSVFFTEKDPETRSFALRAEVEEESFEIDVDEGRAEVTFVVRMFRTTDESADPEWVVRVVGPWIDDEEHGWVALKSEYESLVGDSPGGRRRR